MQFQVCAQCGKQFKTYPSEQGRARFCSKECMADERRGKPLAWEAGMHRGYRFPSINSYRVDGETAFIVMKDGIETVIDTTDLPVLQGITWTPVYSKDIQHWYAVGRIRSADDDRMHTTYLHRFLLKAPRGLVVDHINHNSLDNRRVNIRICTNSENMFNRKNCDPRSHTGVRGVTLITKRNGRHYYFARLSVTKLYPYTDQGLLDAGAFVETIHDRLGLSPFRHS